MNSLGSLLETLFTAGAELWAEDEHLRVRAPEGILTPERVRALRENKAEILGLLPEYTFRAPLSKGQERSGWSSETTPRTLPTTLGWPYISRGTLTPGRCGSLQRLVNRHLILRTTISATDGVPTQVVRGYGELSINEVAVPGMDWPEVMRSVAAAHHHPFDLEAGPLFRVSRFIHRPQESILLLGVHHIVSDGWSFRLMVDEFLTAYEALASGERDAVLPPIRRTYPEFVRWQQEMLGLQGGRLRTYWSRTLQGAPPALELPLDHPRRTPQTFNGAALPIALDADLTARLRGLARRCGATLYMTLLAAFQAFLHRYSGQEEILVGSPAAGRDREEFAATAGYLVNPVVLRGSFSREDPPTFTAFLRQMRGRVLEAMEHQDYPFPLLVKDLSPERDPSRSPVFQVMFVYQRAQGLGDRVIRLFGGQMIEVASMRLSVVGLPQTTSEFDLILEMTEQGEGLSGSFRYSRDLFEAETIGRMAGHFRSLLGAIVDDADRPVSALPMLTEAEPPADPGGLESNLRPRVWNPDTASPGRTPGGTHPVPDRHPLRRTGADL